MSRRRTKPAGRSNLVGTAAVIFALRCSAGAVLAQAPAKITGDCRSTECHGGLAARPVVHSPVETGACDACHEAEPGDAHKFKLTRSGAALCTDCHDEEAFEGKVVHGPVANGECLSCHDPHGGQVKKLLTAKTGGELCLQCHEDVTEDLAFLHGPVGAGECTACHKPHASDHAKLLIAPTKTLCIECHEDSLERIETAKHVHAPVRDDCTACHRPHGGGDAKFLTAAAPALCLDCHDTLAERIQDATVHHSAVSSGGACLTCHDAHASQQNAILRGPSKDLCLSCHSQEVKAGDRSIPDMAAVLKAQPDHHGPIRDGDCGACHDPHGTQQPALLAKAFPPKMYAAFKDDHYALCFECHEAEAFEDARTDDATAFRNGDQNLHYLHVNKAEKGRTCRVCHDPHAGPSPHHIAASVPFGNWRIPINYTATETGGACLPGCHRPYRYDREEAVVNIPPAKAAAAD